MPDHATRSDRFDLRALYETSRLLSSSLDLEFVLQSLLLTTMSKLFVTRGVALLHDPVEGGYRVSVAKGARGMKQGAILKLSDLDDDRILAGSDVPQRLRDESMALVLPVAFGHRKIGALALGAKATGQPFDGQEREFVASLVNMAASAVHNSLVVEELQQANRDLDAKIQQLNTLFDLSQEFNATRTPDRLVTLLKFALMGQLLVGKFMLLLRPQGGGEADFEIAAVKGLTPPEITGAFAEHVCGLQELVVLEVQGGGLPVTDAVAEDAEVEEDHWREMRARGIAIALPIRHQDETCGLLCLGKKMTGQPYGPDDVEFLYALGNLAYVSIRNAHLVEEQIEKERLAEEMRLARSIQEKLLPASLPEVEGIQLAAIARPSREVGGDYYDVVVREQGDVLLAVADVTGKGVPASLLMANLQASLHVTLPLGLSLEESTAHINRVIVRNTDYDKFITFCQGLYDPASRRFRYVNAGHNPPTLVRADGSLEHLDVGGLLLGVMQLPYESGEVTLEPGDVLALFTDGVTEAMSPGGEEYGEERLEPLLAKHREGTAQQILDAVLADIARFTQDPPSLSDDLTMIVLKVALG
jgi:sigma-B regulation protein RsbU (phosphoserine phosphatase)